MSNNVLPYSLYRFAGTRRPASNTDRRLMWSDLFVNACSIDQTKNTQFNSAIHQSPSYQSMLSIYPFRSHSTARSQRRKSEFMFIYHFERGCSLALLYQYQRLIKGKCGTCVFSHFSAAAQANAGQEQWQNEKHFPGHGHTALSMCMRLMLIQWPRFPKKSKEPSQMHHLPIFPFWPDVTHGMCASAISLLASAPVLKHRIHCRTPIQCSTMQKIWSRGQFSKMWITKKHSAQSK